MMEQDLYCLHSLPCSGTLGCLDKPGPCQDRGSESASSVQTPLRTHISGVKRQQMFYSSESCWAVC